MCQRTVCHDCGKPNYVGCGNHVEQVLGYVPMAKGCSYAPVQTGLRSRLSAPFGPRCPTLGAPEQARTVVSVREPWVLRPSSRPG